MRLPSSSAAEAQEVEVAGGLKMGAKSLCVPLEDVSWGEPCSWQVSNSCHLLRAFYFWYNITTRNQNKYYFFRGLRRLQIVCNKSFAKKVVDIVMFIALPVVACAQTLANQLWLLPVLGMAMHFESYHARVLSDLKATVSLPTTPLMTDIPPH